MRHSLIRLLFLSCFILTGCAKEFKPLLREAQDAYDDKKYVQTIDLLQEALRLWDKSDGKDDRALAYQTLGMAYQKIQKIDKAIEAYSTAISLSKKTYDAAYHLGSLYLVSGKPNLALDTFKKALGTRKDDPLALLGLGNAYFALKQYKTARVYYKRIIDVSPGVGQALENIRIVDKRLKRRRRGRRR